MSEYTWEEIVEDYITTDRAVLVSRQYEVEDNHGWKTCPDLLAVDFRKRQIWFVEVTTAWNTNKIANKAKKFKTEIVPRLKNQLTKFAIVPDASQWTFGLWAFVRKDVTSKLCEKIKPLVDLSKVEDLEAIAFPWVYWDKRRSEKNVEELAKRP